MLEKSACDEDLRTPRHLLALGACDVWGGIQGRNQDSVFPSELEAEQKDYVILPPAAVTLIKISAKLTMMDLFALDSSVHGGRASVASCLKFQDDQTKPNTGYNNTHGCCCCALLQRAESSPVSRQPHHRHPASRERTAGPEAHPQELPEGQKEEDGN